MILHAILSVDPSAASPALLKLSTLSGRLEVNTFAYTDTVPHDYCFASTADLRRRSTLAILSHGNP